ncbi:cytochrome c1-2, heme protein, mitochondrial-like [Apis laboriosa]|uniref:cytochrome c1-2, heme protein, mitochondrial-like n=1 Tax=Apis laboriosa TaxID=183418 RepID=UPI001CC42547|nr:cytochrome c1-2, heme protein, mitochondrial-like [Apis laboriosa]
MAIIGRINRVLCAKFRDRYSGESRSHVSPDRRGMKRLFGLMAGAIGSCCGAILYFLNESSSVNALDLEIRVPRYPWSFNGVFKAFDHAALRRGWQVYRTVCRTCHSLQYVRFLDLINVTHSLEEVKQIASEFEVEDGPDDEGNYFMRPGKLSDYIPSPYANEEAAKTANFGAYPPDLTYMILTQRDGVDYVFSLLTGWMEPPAGLPSEQNQYFNAYFPGGRTTMPQMLFEGAVEYDDDTPATASQMAKDVVEFLMWTASSEHDTRKIMTLKCLGIFLILTVSTFYIYRRTWSHLRSRRIAYVPNSITREPHFPAPVSSATDRANKKSGIFPIR